MSLGICLYSWGSMLQPEICFGNYRKSLMGTLTCFCGHTAVTRCESCFAIQRIPKNDFSRLKTPGKCSQLGNEENSSMRSTRYLWQTMGYKRIWKRTDVIGSLKGSIQSSISSYIFSTHSCSFFYKEKWVIFLSLYHTELKFLFPFWKVYFSSSITHFRGSILELELSNIFLNEHSIRARYCET